MGFRHTLQTSDGMSRNEHNRYLMPFQHTVPIAICALHIKYQGVRNKKDEEVTLTRNIFSFRLETSKEDIVWDKDVNLQQMVKKQNVSRRNGSAQVKPS